MATRKTRAFAEAVPKGKTKSAPAGGSKSFNELGATGLTRFGKTSVVQEEFLLELQGERGRKIYREMADNDPIIGAILFVIEMMTRNVKWSVRDGEDEHNEFIESCMQDMSHTWEDFVAEVLSMLVYGYSFHEVVYKKRAGIVKDPTKSSRYNDGKIGWQKIPIRSQDTLMEWSFSDDGTVEAFIQQAPPQYTRVEIPMERGLLFRTTTHKNNPEGRSVLRNAYRAWYFKKRIEEIEGIGIERDLAGLPVIYRTGQLAKVYDDELKVILRNVRRDEQEGLLLPLVRDDKGNLELEFKLLNSGGTRQFNTTQIIDRYDRAIARTVMADFLMLGQGSSGSWALSSDKTEMFARAIGAYHKAIAAVVNRFAIPRLLALNGISTEEPPIVVPGDLETPDLVALGQFLSQMAAAGMPLFPDDNLEKYVREVANLPDRSEEGAGGTADESWFNDVANPQEPDQLPEPPQPKPGGKPAPSPKPPALKPPVGRSASRKPKQKPNVTPETPDEVPATQG